MNSHAQIGLGVAALVAASAVVAVLADTSEAPATEALSDTCEVAQAHGSPEAWVAIGIEAPKHGYGIIESCAVVPDGGAPFADERAIGLVPTGHPVQRSARGNRSTKARAWGAGAAFDCACRPLSDTAGACKADLGEGVKDAPFNRYLPPGSWSGQCARAACDELSGKPSFPDECLPAVAEVE